MALLPLGWPTAQEQITGKIGNEFDTWDNEIKSLAVISVNVHTLEAARIAGMVKQLPGRTVQCRPYSRKSAAVQRVSAGRSPVQVAGELPVNMVLLPG